ncbi:MAG: AAA family ATPase [Deltaproteobacteria bacterium]|nr:AAA family ATPase [Deltaproteobacteria bacterium]
MDCSSCGHENRDGARFCEECASPLSRTCANCNAPLRPTAKFCDECAHPASAPATSAAPERIPRDYTPKHLADKILHSKSALEGERKQVTVMFADVKGSMELAEQAGAEGWHRILDRFFAVLNEGVHRFEGTVNQYTGDGIMALFGAPIAHEDHAQRACYAALSLRDALRHYAEELRRSEGIDFAVRMGIHTGEVVVGKIGDDLRMDYTAQGHTVGLAQRLERMAPAQSVYVSHATAQRVSGYMELRDLGEAVAKGVAEPIRIFELVGPGRYRTRLDVARSRGLSRFVGRDADLQTLEAALEQARTGEGQVVGVVAEAGVGKSRLCLEFVERCRAQEIHVSEGHCPAHGKNVSYLPLLELLRGIFGIGGDDEPAEARRNIAAAPALADGSFGELLPLLFDFLGVPDPERPVPQLAPEARLLQIAAFLRHLLQADNGGAPRVLFIDDAHWIDAGSDAFLAQIVHAVPQTRTLVLVNFRPEYQAEWMSRSYYRQVPLQPFGREATEELLGDLVGRDASLSDLMDEIHERTRGNPFFVEEVVLSLVEKGALEGTKGAFRLVAPVHELEIPDGVQAVLAARIDRLPEREKHLLQTASVIGKEAPGRILERVAELPDSDLSGALAELVRGEFLFERALYPQAEYAFKHPLTHEVAYRSQLAERRAGTHAAVATALEELDVDRLDESAALLAHHWEEAGETLTAVRWSLRSADWDNGGGGLDPMGALARLRNADALFAEAPESDERAQLELDVCRKMLSLLAWFGGSEEEMPALFERGQTLAEARGDLRALGQLNIPYGVWRGFTGGDMAGFGRHARRAADLAERVGDKGLALAAAAGLALATFSEARVGDAIALGRHVIERAPADPMLGADYFAPSPGPWLLGFTRSMEGWAGQPLESLAHLEQMVSQDTGLLEVIVHLWAAQSAELLGDAPSTLAHAQSVQEAADRFGIALNGAGQYYLGIARQLEGNSEQAAAHLERAREIHARTGGAPMEPGVCSLSRLAVAYADLGQTERALETSTRGLALVRERMPVFVAPALTLHARVLRVTRGADAGREIEEALDEAEALVASTGIRSWQPFVHAERARVAELVGDETTRERELRDAHRLFTEMGATGHAERVARELG